MKMQKVANGGHLQNNYYLVHDKLVKIVNVWSHFYSRYQKLIIPAIHIFLVNLLIN